MIGSSLLAMLPPHCPLAHGVDRRVGWLVNKTYTRELGTAVTALGGSTALANVQSSQLTTGSLYDTGEVGGGVVARFPDQPLAPP